MSNMEVSLKAAKEVNADILAPELYRTAQETSLRARREYRYKNFESAKKFANQARSMAEQAEFEALRNGAKREALPVDPLSEPSYAPVPVNNPNGDPSAPAAGTTGSKTGTNPKTSSPSTPSLPVPGFPKQ
jgi:hypothetical protein